MLVVQHRGHGQVEVRHLAHRRPDVPVGVDVGELAGVTTVRQGRVAAALDQLDRRHRAGPRSRRRPTTKTTASASGGRGSTRMAPSASATVVVSGRQEEVGAHEPARRLGVVAEQRPDLALLGLGEQLEDGRAPLLVELDDQVGRVVGGHRPEQRAASVSERASHELDLVLGVQLLEDVRLEFAVLPRPPR